MNRLHLAFVVLLSMGLMFAGCESDDNGTTDPGTTQDPGTPSDPGEGDVPVVEKVTFKAQVQDNLSKQPKEGALVTVMDNDTGEATTMTATADADGMVEFELDKGKMYGFKSALADNKDTYVWNIPSELPTGVEYEIIWILSETGFGMAAALAGFEPDPAKAIIAGALYWVNDAGEEEYVTCGTIKTDPEGEYRYFAENTGLPAPLESVTSTGGDKAEGRYVAGNVPAGKVTLSGYNKAGDVEWATLTLWTKADSVCISNLYVDKVQFPANPSPATCE
jgi:hypothetical protein